MGARRRAQLVDVTTRPPDDQIDHHTRSVMRLTITVELSWIKVTHDGQTLGCFSTISEAGAAIEEWLAVTNPTLTMRDR